MAEVLCECGQMATTEIQAGGGIYLPVCRACYASSEEGTHNLAGHAATLADVRAGRYQREDRHPGHAPRWHGPHGRNCSDEEYQRLLVDPMTDDEIRLAIAAEASRAAKYEY